MKESNIAKYLLTGLMIGFSSVVISAPAAPSLNRPYSGEVGVSTSGYNFTWNKTGVNSTYRIVISQDANFTGFVDNGSSSNCNNAPCSTTTTTSTSYWKTLNCSGHRYYWKVRANDYTGASAWSSVRSFTTFGNSDSCPSVSAYGQSVWNEANRAYNAGERWTYKGVALVDSAWTYCARFVRLVHNLTSRYDTAINMCQNYANKGKMRSTGTPAIGAAVCYRANSSNGYAGHIGIANGSGQELGVLSKSAGVSPRTSPVTTVTSSSYYWGWISADDYKNYY